MIFRSSRQPHFVRPSAEWQLAPQYTSRTSITRRTPALWWCSWKNSRFRDRMFVFRVCVVFFRSASSTCIYLLFKYIHLFILFLRGGTIRKDSYHSRPIRRILDVLSLVIARYWPLSILLWKNSRFPDRMFVFRVCLYSSMIRGVSGVSVFSHLLPSFFFTWSHRYFFIFQIQIHYFYKDLLFVKVDSIIVMSHE